MEKLTAKITEHGNGFPHGYTLNLEDGKGSFKAVTTDFNLLDNHYILTCKEYFDEPFPSISSILPPKDFGVARTAEEADRRLYMGILEIALCSAQKNQEIELIDKTHYAEKPVKNS